jgi:hypothetical protein
MKFNSLRSVVSGAALMLVFGVLSSAPAQAQYRDYGYNAYGQYGDQGTWSREHTRDYAFKLGYHQAYSETQDAMRRNGRRVSIRDLEGYRNDTNGYLVRMGDREEYRRSYRRGYEQGFNDALNGRSRRYGKSAVEAALGGRLKDVYNDDRYDRDDWYWGRRDDRDRDRDGRNDRNDRNDVYRIAQDNGYREGLRQGRDDAYRRRGFNYENDSSYRNALSGYQASYGNRDNYRNAFREGYRRGYEEGYRNRR